MRTALTAIAGLAATLAVGMAAPGAQAQVPYIEGTWSLNAKASRLPGPAPQSHVRSYRREADGTLVGTAVVVGANGSPFFIMFAGKPDGKDHPELESRSAARFLADGTPPPRTYSETPTADDHRVKWVDKVGGRIEQSGEKWVSADGKTMSFTVDGTEQLYVFDRTGP